MPLITTLRHLLVLPILLLNLAACADDTQAPQDPQAAQTAPPPPPAATDAPDTTTAAAAIPTIHLANAFPKLTFQRPVFITAAPEAAAQNDNRLFIVEQPGRILIVENRHDAEQPQVFLDIRPKVRTRHNEEGLLSLAFHPQFRQNGQFFIYYSVSDPKRNRISRFTVSSDDPNRADPASEQIILDVPQRYGNHNGSTLLFGPDGYLYASYGDGGLAGDPDLHGQNLATLLGTIIRIDINRTEGDRAYAVPGDNPFVSRDGARPEIWAYGLRNIWRMSFDRDTGDLWAADVGQDRWEEVNLITKGGNYGWNLREGMHEFPPGMRRIEEQRPADPLLDPVIDYGRREGISITGGYVYRGQRHPRLRGVYLYADYGTRNIWGLRYQDGRVVAHRRIASGQQSGHVTSFGEDAHGELFVCTFDRLDGATGRIYRIVEN